MKKLILTLRKPEDADVVKDSGCEVLAEYPNSLLVRCTDAQQEVLKRAGLEVAELERPTIRISGASFSFASALEADKAKPVVPDPNRTAYYMVQLIGPTKGEWLDNVRALGGTIHGNLPGFTLLVGILPARVQELRKQSWVEAVTPYRAAMKISPRLRPGVGRKLNTADLASVEPDRREPEERKQVEISVFPEESSSDVSARIRAGGGIVLGENPRAVTAIVSNSMIASLANLQGVQSILPHRFPKLHNDIATAVMGAPADRIFDNLTLRGTDQIVAVSDSGLDTGDPTTVHSDFSGRIVSIVSWPTNPSIRSLTNDTSPYDDGAEDANSGHGTHVAGSVVSNGAAATAVGYSPKPEGIAPEARLYFQAIEQSVNWKTAAQLIAEGYNPGDIPPWWPPDAVGLYGLPNDLTDLFNASYTAGARIHTNSWGADNAGIYNLDSRAVDAFMWNHRDMLILFSAGNEGVDEIQDGVIDPDSIGTPSTAKNCVTVGASENNRPSGSTPTPGIDNNWSNLGPPEAHWDNLAAAGHISDNVDGMAAFSSRGPTDDGRHKPDLVAPGTNILSTRSSRVGPDPLWGDLPATHLLHGLACWCGGTSMSTPLTAGASALIRQHLVQQRGHFQNGVKPSGALIKAFLINGSESMSPGQFTASPNPPSYPSDDEIPNEPNDVNGFGRVNLTESLTPGVLGQALFADEPDYAVETGQIRTFEVQVMETTQPLKVTLVWTDAPSPDGVGGLQNELYLQVRRPDLVVVDGDTTPFPNVSNNVQRVVIDTPTAGTYEIRVRGVSVTQQAPGASTGINPRQDFALVVSNGMGFSLQPVSVAQAIDTTGSMGYFGYMDPAKERAKQLVDFMRINDKVSITEFSKRTGVINLARNVYPLHLLGSFSPDWTDVYTAIDGLHSEGLTPIGAGLLEAWNQLSSEPSSQPRAIVLLSDGYNNVLPDPSTVLPTIPTGVPIFTVALGPACNTPTLQNIANSRPSGGYYMVESDEDAHKLHEIYAQIQALAAGATLVGLSSAVVETQKQHEMPVEPGVEEATFVLSWDKGIESKMELRVIGPDGNRYNATTAATIERKGSSHHLVRVSMPKPGMWLLLVINQYSKENPVKYTLSSAVQSRLTVSVETPKVGEKYMVLSARLLRGREPVSQDDAEVLARLTVPTRSRKEILDEFGKQIQDYKLPKEVYESGLSEKQILNLKLALFAQKYREKKGGLYRRETFEVKLSPRGDGTWISEVPIYDPGNLTVEIIARGEIRGVPWQRYTTQSVYVPEPVRPSKLFIENILFRRNIKWGYIVGARVIKSDGKPATPSDGVQVNMVATQGFKRAISCNLPYYSRGNYFIWRFEKLAGFKPGIAMIAAQARLEGVVVATARRFVLI